MDRTKGTRGMESRAMVALFALAAGLAVGLAAPARADAAAPAAAGQAAPATGPATDNAVGEIIVTANKRQQSINDVGMSISAQTGDALMERGVSSAMDLGRVVPGLTVQPSPLSSPVYTLRGVGFYEATLSAAPTVAVYLDEVVLPFSAETRGIAFDVQRVEVLKGPQGTLFGSNTTGGAINYVANKPTDHFTAGVSGTFGRFATLDATAYVSGPVTDTLKVRVAGRVLRGDDWQYSYTRNDSIGRQRQVDGRLIADWTPSDRLSFTLSASGWKDTGDTQQPQFLTESCRANRTGTCADANPFALEFRNYPVAPQNDRAADWAPTIFGQRPARDDWFWQVSLRGDAHLTDTLTLTSVSAYSKFATDSRQDFDGTVYRATDIHSTGNIRTFSQELRLAGDMKRLKWVVGGNYEKSNTFDDTIYATDQQATNVFYAQGGPYAYASEAYAYQNIRSVAAFANAELRVAEPLTVIGGVRYTSTRRDFHGCSVDPGHNEFSPFWNVIFGLHLGPGDCFVFTENFPQTFGPDGIRNSLDENNVSWNVGLNYTTPGRSLLYVRVAKGYKAGSFPNLQAASISQYAPVKQESLLAYEVGAKVPLLDRRVNIAAAAFYYDYTNKQLKGRAPDPVFRDLDALVQIPKSEVWGAEAEISARPVDGLTLSLGATYIQSKIKQYNAVVSYGGAPIDFSGQRFPYSPNWTIVGDAEYKFPVSRRLDVFVGGGFTFNSKTSAVLRNRDTATVAADHLFDIGAYTLIDLRAGIAGSDGRWKLYAWGKNITDKYYWTNVLDNVSSIVRYTGQPATFGVGFKYEY